MIGQGIAALGNIALLVIAVSVIDAALTGRFDRIAQALRGG